MAAVQSVYETMKALCEGTSPGQIKNVAYSEELEQEIHDDVNCDTVFPQVRCPSFFFVLLFNFFAFID